MSMDVRLKTRWGSYLQGSIVSVSDARALALQDAGICSIIAEPEQADKPDTADAEPADKTDDAEPEQADKPDTADAEPADKTDDAEPEQADKPKGKK
jgi:stringent starvation protein B